ncbi:MAG: FAD-dependent oxidoreductase [Pseudomonadota bacterium]
MAKTRILVLGGGFAGMFSARELQRRLGDTAEIELINDENYFVFQPLLPEVAAGSITAPHAVTPLRFLLTGITVRKAVVHNVDFERQVVTIFQGVQRRPTEVTYDHLVVAMGQRTDLSRMPGMPEHALTMKTLEDARRLRAHVIERLEHADITRLPEVKREALTFCVVGAGFSGIETVGEMKELIDRSLKYYPNIDPSEVRVIVVEYLEKVLPELPPSLGAYAAKKLAERGIELKLGTGVASATGTSLTTSSGEVIGTRTIVATIGSAPSAVVREMPLELAGGRIAVERTLAAKGHANVWSLGDCALIPMKDGATERADFAPPTAQFAVREARHLAANIAAAIGGKPLAPFAYTSKGALASLGAKRGVAEVFGIKITGFPAWLLWRAYYVAFLPGFSTRIGVLLNWTMDALTPRTIVQVATAKPPSTRYVLYRAGDRIFEEGNRADGVYSVISGAVEMLRPDPETGERQRRVVGPGELFGARLLTGETRRSATARALEDTRVLLVEAEDVLKVADGFAGAREGLTAHLDHRGLHWAPQGLHGDHELTAPPDDTPAVARRAV